MISIERQSQLIKRGEAIRKLPIQPTDPFEAGEMVERERIIKLLSDDVAFPCIDKDPFKEHLDEFCNCRIISLIKGESK
jgi:hypothetical protein